MARQGKARKTDLPPEGLWISPFGGRHCGRKHPIVEHVLAIRSDPEVFGLTRRDVSALDLGGLRDLAIGLIRRGWTRFRYLDGRYMFEVDSAEKRIPVILGVLADAGAHDQEEAWVSQVSPLAEFQGRVGEVRDRRILRNPVEALKPTWWRLSSLE